MKKLLGFLTIFTICFVFVGTVSAASFNMGTKYFEKGTSYSREMVLDNKNVVVSTGVTARVNSPNISLKFQEWNLFMWNIGQTRTFTVTTTGTYSYSASTTKNNAKLKFTWKQTNSNAAMNAILSGYDY